ncbi:hypothetical protein C7960_2063 [Methanohalophilus euhalobius]|uniref:Uncharacterized protein n=1 Tax=Methanohalophilus euhalobius TaxID=51203 RepID=A0A285F0B9_9EURY|nr:MULTISPECIES: hypothetical protein [Methanohalophilus]ODV50493.1 MAG: hypothetical protein A8273_34 [Methanohalophilus sp. 2-GBenrich]RSD35752.1 MAG: hypothetical protein CI952_815 [Methanohalophilus sp.]TCL12788.1 hypothetical protein C7960_2063 [Methanohalophilus euhalobius]SNY03611.1 hypothetical protein SAMN06295989_10298 [Methanohalophilus euhalobius]
MKLDSKDKKEIADILAGKYFSQNEWKWVNLAKDMPRIQKAYEEIKDQYDSYPYMSKDWYVENSSTKSLHMCSRWDELRDMVDFLNAYVEQFDFLVGANHKMLCISSTEGLSDRQKTAISEARKLRYTVFVFIARVPDEMEFELSQIGGGM